jgi:hypothetical protein
MNTSPTTLPQPLIQQTAATLSNPSTPTQHLGANLTSLTPSSLQTTSALSIPIDQLQHIIDSILQHHSSTKLKDDNPLNKLVPWIKRFQSLRTNAVWQSATYIVDDTKKFDLLTEFTKISEAVIREQAEHRWTEANQAKSLSQAHPDLYYSRILGKVIINSVTDDFYNVLQNYAGIELSNDGPLLLWLILSHFHTSTITYTERLRHAIRTRSLANDHQHDVEAYLLWLRLQLDVLTTNLPGTDSSNKDLIEPIFQQLLTTTSKRLRRSVEDWHLAHHDAAREFTALSLVQQAERTCKALRCTGQLYSDPDPELAILHAQLAKQANLTNQAFNVITNTLKQHTTTNNKKPPGKHTGGQQRTPKPEWFYKPPTNPHNIHKHDGRDWYWCPKCGKDQQGKWVCTHKPDEYQDTFTRKHRGDQENGPNKHHHTPTTHPTTPAISQHANLGQLSVAHAQLTATLAQAHGMQLPTLSDAAPAIGDTTEDLLDFDNWKKYNILSTFILFPIMNKFFIIKHINLNHHHSCPIEHKFTSLSLHFIQQHYQFVNSRLHFYQFLFGSRY